MEGLFINIFGEKINVHCVYNNSLYEEQNKCLIKNSSLYENYACDICGYYIVIN